VAKSNFSVHYLVASVLVASGLIVVLRAALGPFRWIVSVNNPLTAESWFGVAAALSVAMYSREARPGRNESLSKPKLRLVALVLLAVTAVVWGRALNFPFIADDYYHITNGIHADLWSLPHLFAAPAKDLFFRPFGLAAYAVEAHVWGINRYAWHAASLFLHFSCSFLVFLLIIRFGAEKWSAMAGALLFLVHGSRPEAVFWTGAQFDLWATLFFLVAFVAFDSWLRNGRRNSAAVCFTALLCAFMSKESAYVAPLAFLFSPSLIHRKWRERWMRTAPVFLLAAVCFCYRWVILGGIGGYRDSVQRPFIFSIGWRTLKGLTTRLGAILTFPINWSKPIEWWLVLLMILGLCAVAILIRASASRDRLAAGAGLLLVSVLPVHEFLLISPDLEKSRVLYLPLIGVCLIFQSLLQALGQRAASIAAICLLAFEAGAIEHNLSVWGQNGRLAEQTCATVARQLSSSSDRLVLSDVPNVIDGVYFLHTGLRNCIEWAAGRPLPDLKIHSEPWAPVVQEPPDLVWNDLSREFVRPAKIP